MIGQEILINFQTLIRRKTQFKVHLRKDPLVYSKSMLVRFISYWRGLYHISLYGLGQWQ